MLETKPSNPLLCHEDSFAIIRLRIFNAYFSWEMDLSEVIEECVDEHMRGVLEGSNETGKALNKILADSWLKEIGEDPEDNQGALA